MLNRITVSLMVVAVMGTCAVSVARAEESVIAEGSICAVYDEQIPVTDFEQLVASARQQYRDNDRAFPSEGSREYNEVTDQAVSFLVQRALLRHAGAERGIGVTDAEVVGARTALIRDHFSGSEAAYSAELKRTGYSDGRVRDDLRDQIRSRKVYRSVTAAVPAPVRSEEIREYRLHPGRYRLPKSRLIDHILVRTRFHASALRTRLLGKSEATFRAYARATSLDTDSAANGGRMTVRHGQAVRSIDATVFKLRTGELSTPVHTSQGWHLIYAVGDVRPARKRTFSQARAAVRATLVTAARDHAFAAWLTSMRATSSPHVVCVSEHPWVERPVA